MRLTPKELHVDEIKNFVDKFNDKGNDPYFRSKVIEKLWEYEELEEQGLWANISKMKCLNCLYRSQYCDSENRYGCGGLHGTEFYVKADYFCAEFEPRITEVEAL